MSSMVRKTIPCLAFMLAILPGCAEAQDGAEWDMARSQQANAPVGNMAQAIARWRLLTSTDGFGFEDYAGFMLVYPGFPEEAKLRVYAERALERRGAEASRVAAYFERFAPVTNAARANYALALFALGRARGPDLGPRSLARRSDERPGRGFAVPSDRADALTRRSRRADGRAAVGQCRAPGRAAAAQRLARRAAGLHGAARAGQRAGSGERRSGPRP